ncbi:MAG: aminotransferase class I/II-fold pyridoxal phosphate-dependent enzyme [Calothrix sp. FI2-JRJ7]|jgi:arginine decarboxylase|nr:aminotransferase class I/II-fold pyridoxal phosphate-dependent enzyme [Calothrix sp. FI2-JRJ7]
MTNHVSQAQTPLLTAIKECIKSSHAPFYTPGHKRGVGISASLIDIFGSAVFAADLAELTELDNLFAPLGVIDQAQQLAAQAFGATRTWFLVNGSTCGIEAAIMATCGAGDKIILPRNVHSSVIAGLILSGAIPIFINPEYDAVSDIAHSITPESIALALHQHPDAKTVLMVYPTYYGVCGDVVSIANIVHQYNIPLILDEAHGAHFAFHPDLPISGLAAGADICVQSIHKTLGAMTQASMLHAQGNIVNYERISKALQLVQSTSPSYILMASLDAARAQIALHGRSLITQTLQLANTARENLKKIPHLSVYQSPPYQDISTNQSPPYQALLGGFNLDPTRLTINVSNLGITGFEADEILETQLEVRSELASLQNLTFIISIGNTQQDIDKLIYAFNTLAAMAPVNKNNTKLNSTNLLNNLTTLNNTLHISPREAYFAATETLPLDQTYSRISAETICPYPPGIPILMTGEIITKEALEYLQQVKTLGGFLTGCSDTTLKTLKVIS